MKWPTRSPIVTVIGVFYLIVYSLASVSYIRMTIDPLRYIAPFLLLTTIALAFSGGVYLIKPALGHILMLLATVPVLVYSIAEHDPNDATFFGIITFVLAWILIRGAFKTAPTDNLLLEGTP